MRIEILIYYELHYKLLYNNVVLNWFTVNMLVYIISMCAQMLRCTIMHSSAPFLVLPPILITLELRQSYSDYHYLIAQVSLVDTI